MIVSTRVNLYKILQLYSFEARVKLAQQCLVCAPLIIYLEPINKDLMLLVII